jgi:4-hydroxy-4-methyl-2-oxoglutarate aldolase
MVVTDIQRASRDVISRLGAHEVAKIADAMAGGGLMRHVIKPVAPGTRLAGSAITVMGRPGDVLYVIRAADVAEEGDVVVIDGGGCAELAMIGDGIAYYMQKHRGIAGVVVDGGVRDIRGIRALAFPMFACGTSARIHGAYGPGAINVPIACGGVVVTPGDVIVGDDDGVVVVPREYAESIADATDLLLAGEQRRRDLVDQGANLTELRDLDPLLAVWR